MISGGGDGLFLRLDCQANTVVAFYNGVIVPAADDDSHETWEECSYRIFINEDSNQRMDIPVNCRSTEVYSGTNNLYNYRVTSVAWDCILSPFIWLLCYLSNYATCIMYVL